MMLIILEYSSPMSDASLLIVASVLMPREKSTNAIDTFCRWPLTTHRPIYID